MELKKLDTHMEEISDLHTKLQLDCNGQSYVSNWLGYGIVFGQTPV